MSCKGTCILVILLWVTYISSGCRCFTQHPQRIFCREDSVVMVGRVIKQEIPKGRSKTKYHFKLLKSLKGVHETIGSTIIIVPFSSCAIGLNVGEQYVLSGRRSNTTGTISTILCGNFIYKIADVTFELMLYLFSGGSDSYKQNCDCKVSVASDKVEGFKVGTISYEATHTAIDMYADDTTLHTYGTNKEEIERKLNYDANTINNWCLNNRMVINPLKTTSMLIGTNKKQTLLGNDMNICIQDSPITPVEIQKLLGVYIDKNLDWKFQIDYNLLKGEVWGERIFRGKQCGIQKVEKPHQKDWKLIPKEEEAEFCQITDVFEETKYVPKLIPFPPLLGVILQARNNLPQKPLLKIDLPEVADGVEEEFIQDEGDNVIGIV
ncbi:unnamed protein product [Mytilus edulis]|uniref:Uncharacterized protein n=1 Tax=Mytilus edulis TaxID=6550 RepID=A0A8S3VGG7_MYTED|nr:unnamed protein product [Mytilus edulis]